MEPGLTETIDGMVGKVKEGFVGMAEHASEFEGVQEEGLRMLVFGKPGSGKVSSTWIEFDTVGSG